MQKVVCYIVRDGQLLVFQHLDEEWDESGLQVPAGTIKPAETPEVAALREASEETRLTALRLVRKVGEAPYDIAPYRSEVHHRHFFHLEVDQATPSDGRAGRTTVKVLCSVVSRLGALIRTAASRVRTCRIEDVLTSSHDPRSRGTYIRSGASRPSRSSPCTRTRRVRAHREKRDSRVAGSALSTGQFS